MSLAHVKGCPSFERFPRVSGDEPDVPSADQPHYVFSPRERG